MSQTVVVHVNVGIASVTNLVICQKMTLYIIMVILGASGMVDRERKLYQDLGQEGRRGKGEGENR